jgi:hypothetical protein
VKWTSPVAKFTWTSSGLGDGLRPSYSKPFSAIEFIFLFNFVFRSSIEHSFNLHCPRLFRLREHLGEELLGADLSASRVDSNSSHNCRHHWDRDSPLALIDLYRPIGFGQYGFPQAIGPKRLVARALRTIAQAQTLTLLGLVLADLIGGRLGRRLQSAILIIWHWRHPTEAERRGGAEPSESSREGELNFCTAVSRATAASFSACPDSFRTISSASSLAKISHR